jgi:hypothetical protein
MPRVPQRSVGRGAPSFIAIGTRIANLMSATTNDPKTTQVIFRPTPAIDAMSDVSTSHRFAPSAHTATAWQIATPAGQRR